MNKSALIYKCRNCGEETIGIKEDNIGEGLTFSHIALQAVTHPSSEYPLVYIHDCRVGIRGIADLIRVEEPGRTMITRVEMQVVLQ